MSSTQTPEYGISTDDRFKGPECAHKNSHITREAALRCAGDDKAELTTVPRFWGTTNGKRCACRFGHKTSETATSCVTPAAPKPPKVKPEPEPKPEAKATVTKLHSGTQGTAKRS